MQTRTSFRATFRITALVLVLTLFGGSLHSEAWAQGIDAAVESPDQITSVTFRAEHRVDRILVRPGFEEPMLSASLARTAPKNLPSMMPPRGAQATVVSQPPAPTPSPVDPPKHRSKGLMILGGGMIGGGSALVSYGIRNPMVTNYITFEQRNYQVAGLGGLIVAAGVVVFIKGLKRRD